MEFINTQYGTHNMNFHYLHTFCCWFNEWYNAIEYFPSSDIYDLACFYDAR